MVAGQCTMLVFQTPALAKFFLGDPVAFRSLWKAAIVFVWLFGAISILAFGVVRQADSLAVLMGEPYGTLILTISVISIEAAMLASLMLAGEDNPTLARDTMFSVIMIVLTGIVGIGLLVGGIRNQQHVRQGAEQAFNLHGALSYLRVLTPMSMLSLVVPRFTQSHAGGAVSPWLAGWLLAMSAGLYLTFLFLQIQSHSKFFQQPELPITTLADNGGETRPCDGAEAGEDQPHSRRRDRRGSLLTISHDTIPHGISEQAVTIAEHHEIAVYSKIYHTIMLFITMLPVCSDAKLYVVISVAC